MKFKIFCLAASLFLGAASVNPVFATSVDVNGFAPVTAKASLSVTSASARTALGYVGNNNTVLLYNSGSVDATVAFGDATVVATNNDFTIPAGSRVTLNSKANTYIAYKTAASTTTIVMYTGSGDHPEIVGTSANQASPGSSSAQATSVQGVAGMTPLDTNLKQIGGASVTLGQGTKSQSLPVTLPSDQTIAVSVADAADVTLGAKADAKNTATDTTAVTAMQVLKQISASVQAPPSQTVTNAGTFATQNTPTTSNLTSGVTAAMTGTTTTSLLAAPASSTRNYVTHIACTNSHATVGTFVVIQDGSGGTTFYEGYAAAVGGGFTFTFPVPLKQPTTATALYVADVTTGANVICAASGFTGA
jgi:hypothetical protein